jgi:hypothetical protein
MRTLATGRVLALAFLTGATLAGIGCSSSPGDAVGKTGQAVSAGQIFNFGALAHPGSCMDAQGSGTADGTQIQEWTCNGTGAQSFELQDAGNGAFTIHNTNAGKCVDVQGDGSADGTKVQLYDCNGTGAQSFDVQDAGGGLVSFVNTSSNKCLDVSGDNPADGTVVQLWDCNGTNAQRWNPTVIGAASSSGGGGSGSGSGGGTGALAACNASQLAACNCPSTFSCCPIDGSCFESTDQIVYTKCNTDPAAACSMSGSSSTPPPPPPPPPPPSSNGTRTFTFANHCGYDVWVGGEGNPIAPPVPCSAGCPASTVCNTANQLCTFIVPSASDWHVAAGQSMALTLPPAWGGRFWPRTECTTANGRTTCNTGDCAANLECPVGVGGAPPATLAEFTVTPPSGGSDFYDVSNVDGANVPVSIVPTPGTFDTTPPPGSNVLYYCGSPGCTGNCGALPACSWNIQGSCPAELQDQDPGHYVGCRSANQVCAVDPSNPTLDCANEDDLYGCTGGGPNGVSGSCYSQGANDSCCGCPSWSPAGACQSTNSRWTPPSLPGKYAQVIKDMCPTAYSFPYDDLTSTFTCQGSSAANPGYTITFCP